MCWSATADLAAGAGIVAVGVACLVQVRRMRDLPLAALPLLLGVHQIVESVVWRGELGQVPPDSAECARTAWAVIALPVLPVLVPLAVLLAAGPRVRWRLVPPLLAGLLVAAVLGRRLLDGPVSAEIRGHTLGYAVDLPRAPLIIAGYLWATVGSLLSSGDRALCLLGTLMAVGAGLCAVLWRLEFISTWCAFAAVASVLLFRWSRGRRELI